MLTEMFLFWILICLLFIICGIINIDANIHKIIRILERKEKDDAAD